METLTLEPQDIAADQATTARETDISNRRSDLERQIIKLNRQATVLRTELEAYGPEEQAPAALTSQLEDIEEDIAWVRYGMYQLVADALAVVDEDGDVEYRYTAADVKAWCDRALEMGASHPKLNQEVLRDLIRMRQVPNAPFRARLAELIDAGYTTSEVTMRLYRLLLAREAASGKRHGASNLVTRKRDGKLEAQTRILERMLGLQTVSGNSVSLRNFITYEQGVSLMHALNMTPHSAGL